MTDQPADHPADRPAARPAVPADVPVLAELESDLFGAEAWSAEALLAQLDTPGRRVTVLSPGSSGAPDEVVGYVVTRLAGDVVDLERIGVAPGHQRRGLARTLVERALADATTDGADRMLLEVSAVNREALGLYAAAGFTQIDVRARYYRDGSDALVLRRALGPSCGWA